MRCTKNGHLVQYNDSSGEPSQIFSGDRYECPVDGQAVVIGFAPTPVSEHFMPEFHKWAKHVGTVVPA